jgi:hypothetical protein
MIKTQKRPAYATLLLRAMTARTARICLAFFAFVAAPLVARAQTDEIQVYDAEIADKGKFNIMLHNNFTPSGLKTPGFPGGIVPDKSYNAVAEWAYGVTEWFEAGLYMPLYSVSKDGPSFNGYKFRALFVKPHAEDHTFFYGLNFEFSFNQKQWNPRRYSSEIRPIIGLHLKPIDIIVNPIMDNSYLHGVKGLDFAPSARVAYNFNDKWAMAVEEYADFGELREFAAGNQQFHEIWEVADHKGKVWNVETGIGFGLTSASDKVTLKLMISRDIN